MNDLKPAIFLMPVIALILVVALYVFFYQKSSNKTRFKKSVLLITILAFLLNFAWEVVQGPLYEGFSKDIQHIAFCALAAVADAVMVLLLYLAFALVYNKNPFWVQKLTTLRIAIVVLAGGIGAILTEMRHLSEGNWAYAESMPIIPIVNVGLSPVLQFMVLPVLIYYLSFHFLRKKS